MVISGSHPALLPQSSLSVIPKKERKNEKERESEQSAPRFSCCCPPSADSPLLGHTREEKESKRRRRVEVRLLLQMSHFALGKICDYKSFPQGAKMITFA